MKKQCHPEERGSNITLRSFLMFLLPGVFLFSLVACTFNTSGPPVSTIDYGCKAEVWSCPSTNAPLDVHLSGYPQVKNYVPVKGFGQITVWPQQVYWDSKIVVSNYGLGSLKGSLLIQTGSKDWQINAADFMQVQLLSDAEGFYVAYDSRADPKPSWLMQDYTRQDDPNTGQPYLITLSMTDQNASPPGLVKLEIWQRNTIPTNKVVTVPSNNYGNPGWKNIKKGTPAMYLVLIKPKSEVNCDVLGEWKTTYRTPLCLWVPPPGGASAEEKAKEEAIKECEKEYGPKNLKCRKPTCERPHWCSTESWGLKSFAQGSEIKFDKPSKAEISIQGQAQKYTSNATGTLYFQYLASSGDMQSNSLILNLEPVQTKVGKFQDIVVLLTSPAQAHCQDTIPVLGQPCTIYQIPTGDLKASVSVLLDNKSILWLSENIQPIKITIDHTTRSFNAKGTLQAIIKINDQDTPMDIALDLYGYFVNFAPKAIGDESTKYRECEENTNKEPVILDAAGSFDIYAPVPTNLPRYEWYEDYGSSTQHLWGKQAKVTIPPHTLAYGVHKFTLIVGDKDGLVDMDTFEVTVGDTTPPHLTIPPNITTPNIYPPGTQSVQVDIGNATASDACSPPTVTNDAPENLFFPPGVTNVTWQADDGRGNIATAVQQVNVQVLADIGTKSQASLPTQLQIETLDMFVSGNYERVYCYISIEGAPEVRLPEDDSTFIQVQGGQGNIAEWGAGNRRLVLAIPQDGVLDLEGECWGWSAKTLDRLGTFAGKYPIETWDGARHPVEGIGFQIGVAIQPLWSK